ncbi:MAG TPA: phenylalanine--tRNA ligase subunit beta [Candidatus Dormibacteraeota bacterium]
MRVSYEWLAELAGVEEMTPEHAAERLTMVGFTVDPIERIDLSQILIGRVLSQQPHPKSRTPLWVHEVDLGEHLGQRQIIAGAPNAVPGTLVPVALPGVTVPNGKQVRDAVIAGMAGQGMLCSREELLLGEDTEPAIMLLDEGEPGRPLSSVIPPDAIFEVEVTPNRPDCLGHLGLARELAAASGQTLRHDFMPRFQGDAEPLATDLLKVRIDDPDLCRRYIAAVVTEVTIGPSPRWMQRRLRAGGVRPINNVVDITQYVMLEYGQPLHAFDAARIGGDEILVRTAREGEELACLDGVTRRLTPQMLVIADQERALALAGVIGGQESAVSETTRKVVLEAATFDGVNIRATSRALRVRTEASGRFEKTLSPELALAAARRAAGLLEEIAHGSVHRGWPDVYPRPQEPVRVRVRPEKVDALLGVHVPLEEAETILRHLDFGVRVDPADGSWDVLPPVFRLDVGIPEDVVEEIGRVFGLDRVPATLPGRRHEANGVYRPSADAQVDPVRRAFAAAGFNEAVTPALVSGRRQERLGLAERALRLFNPVSEEADTLRTSLLPSLLQVLDLNRNRGRGDAAVFETAHTFLARPGDGENPLPVEAWQLAAVGPGGASAAEGRDAYQRLKAVVERALHDLGVPPAEYRRAPATLFHPGRTAEVAAGGRWLGRIGELHPVVIREFDLPGRLMACELDLDALLEARVPRSATELPRFPAVDRDLNVVVDAQAEAEALLGTVREVGGTLLESLTAIDEYRGAQVPEGMKSVTLALTFRSPERTLTDSEVDGVMAEIRSALEQRHAARFRS